MRTSRAKKSRKNTRPLPAVTGTQTGGERKAVIDIPLEYSTSRPAGSGRKEIDLFLPSSAPARQEAHISAAYTQVDKRAFSVLKEPPPLTFAESQRRAQTEQAEDVPDRRRAVAEDAADVSVRRRQAVREDVPDDSMRRRQAVREDVPDDSVRRRQAVREDVPDDSVRRRQAVREDAPDVSVRRRQAVREDVPSSYDTPQHDASRRQSATLHDVPRRHDTPQHDAPRRHSATQHDVPRRQSATQHDASQRQGASQPARKRKKRPGAPPERVVYEYMDGKRNLDIPRASARPGNAPAGLPPARETVVRPEKDRRPEKKNAKKTKTIYEEPQTVTYTDIQTAIPVRDGKGKTYPAAMREEREQRRKRDERLTWLIVICVILFVVAAVWLARIFIGYRRTAAEYADLRGTYVVMPPSWEDESEMEHTDEEYYPQLQVNFASLYALNNDFVGWLYVPGVGISYPLVQGEDNEYYLDHTFMNTSSSGGAIFVDEGDSSDFTDFNTFIYGHNMQDKSMFGSLYLYGQDASLVASYPYFYVYLPGGSVMKYRIFSYYQDIATSDAYVRVTDTSSKQTYITMVLNKSILAPEGGIVTDYTITPEDTLVTLSTCHGRADSGQRFLVHGYLESVFKP